MSQICSKFTPAIFCIDKLKSVEMWINFEMQNKLLLIWFEIIVKNTNTTHKIEKAFTQIGTIFLFCLFDWPKKTETYWIIRFYVEVRWELCFASRNFVNKSKHAMSRCEKIARSNMSCCGFFSSPSHFKFSIFIVFFCVMPAKCKILRCKV